MSIFLWVLQAILALVFLMTASLKLFQSRAQVIARTPWAEDFSQVQIWLIGVAELLGAIGLIAPGLTGILPWLTPVAALCLALDMAGATYTHYRRNEFQAINMTSLLLILSVLTAIGRFWVRPL